MYTKTTYIFFQDSSDAAPPKTKARTPRKKNAVLDIFPESFDDTPGNDVINLSKSYYNACQI
jgi:hypothetical protein